MPYQDLIKGRVSIGGGWYSVTTVTHARKPVFSDFSCAHIVVNGLRALHQEGAVNSLCWVVMPDHLHWLFELRLGATLEQVMKRLKGRSAKQINDVQLSSGKVWQAGYFDHALRKESDIKVVARYIVANPLRAGLVNNLREYSHWDAAWL